MSYHYYHEIPSHPDDAHLYVLQDEMFLSVAAYSLSVHLYMLAAQSGGYMGETQPYPYRFDFPEITELLETANVTWNYYVTSGNVTDSQGEAVEPQNMQQTNPNQYNYFFPPAAWRFPKVENDPSQRSLLTRLNFTRMQNQEQFTHSVSYICPYLGSQLSDHPAFRGGMREPMAYVTGLVNAVFYGKSLLE